MPQGFFLLLAAQFASALADNALLIVIIARLVELDLPGWWAPMLKFGFTISYVVLAPFVGPLADAIPKAKLMAWMNAIKLLGIFGLALGLHPFAAFAIVGFGASAYAPAKYGLVTELVGPQRLVQANGWLEVSVVCAALFGTVLGGLLVSPWLLEQAAIAAPQQWLQTQAWLTPSRLSLSIIFLMLVYGLASALNLGVPDSGARYPSNGLHPRRLCTDFWQANRKLWADADGGLSLAVTTLFWGVGATLQFAVLRWAADVLELPLSQAAYLQAAVAVGVIAGAGIAGRWVPLHAAKRTLVFGVILGLLIPAIANAVSLRVAIPLLVLVGAVGGLMVVPLNALLQHRGYKLLSAGRSIAVQGFNENASVLAMLGVYAGLLALGASIITVMWGFGLCTAALMSLLIWRDGRQIKLKPLVAEAP